MISAATGMVGYPLFNGQAIAVKTVFDPTIQYGGLIQVQSDLTPACGTWKIFNAVYELDSMTPHGNWFASLAATPKGATEIAGN